jgi:phosphoserine phosphatase
MVEVLRFLRAHGFKTYIVTAGGMEFVRAFAESTYGVPPEQVIGSRLDTRYELVDGKGVVVQLPESRFVNDGPGKAVGINANIGRRPVIAFGNSDGDIQMLEFADSGPGKRLAMLVHHDDARREYAYDCDNHPGRLCEGLQRARERGWILISIQNDWSRVFPYDAERNSRGVRYHEHEGAH